MPIGPPPTIMTVETLKLTPLFSRLDEKSLTEINSAALARRAAAGEMIFHEGEPARSFCIVGHGKVKIFKLSPEGKEQILMIAKEGDSFAEAAMFAGGDYPASAQALEPTELVVIDRSKFTGLLNRNPELALALIGRLSELLRKMTVLVESLSLSDVNTRLARYILTYGDPESGAMPGQIILREKKTVLAALLGTIPETLSRAFAKLVKDGLIEVKGPNINILDSERLRRLAENSD
jgi:CRP/FNR family transcriptional regulator